MKVSLLTLVFIFTAFAVFNGAQANSRVQVLSFKIWKTKKIDEARANVSGLRREIRKYSIPKTDEEAESVVQMKRQLVQAELNLDVAKELSANDYFVLYIYPQFKDNMVAFKEAAKSLSSSDVADILNAYRKRLQSPETYGTQNSLFNSQSSMF